MAQSTCHSCNKVQPFLERMMYCSFCGIHYTETEMFNASQRVKQDVIIQRYVKAYLWGGLFLGLFILPPLLVKFVPDEPSRQNLGFILVTVMAILWFKRPFAGSHAKKLYPEKSAE